MPAVVGRTKPRADDDVPGRPAAQRPEARPQPQAQVPRLRSKQTHAFEIESRRVVLTYSSACSQAFMGGIPVMNTFGNNQFGANGMSFSAGFGFFPSLFGLQFVSALGSELP